MIIINSGTYIVQEFQSELGKIPPCLLPLGNKKLIEHQVSALRQAFGDERIFVTLPDDFDLYAEDELLLNSLGVSVLKTASHLSLAEAVLVSTSSAAFIGGGENVVRLLHGDTLLNDFPKANNVLGVAVAQDDYAWQSEANNGAELVWCGYFSFDSLPTLIQCLAVSKNSFVGAVNLYREKQVLSLHHFTNWFDLGHINTYFKSRAKITTQRAFNHLRIENNTVWKSGNPERKIAAEANWFKCIPPILKKFTPQLIDSGIEPNQTFYQLEYLPLIPLNELFVHGKKEAWTWKNIIRQIAGFFELARSTPLSDAQKAQIEQDYGQLIAEKTRSRLAQFAQEYDFDLQHPIYFNGQALPCAAELAEQCISQSMQLGCIPAILHGDPCFSNMLFDERQEQLKLIDPRGLSVAGELTIYGNQYYDLAKVFHSVIGFYDFIIAGRYAYTEEDKYHFTLKFNTNNEINRLGELFVQQLCSDKNWAQIKPLVILLFLSMLPLHNDSLSRQKAMLANAYRLYVET